MCHSVASFQPIGRMFSLLNAKWPTALVPAFISICAAAFSITPAKIRPKLIRFMAIPPSPLPPPRGEGGLFFLYLWFAHHDLLWVFKNNFYFQIELFLL